MLSFSKNSLALNPILEGKRYYYHNNHTIIYRVLVLYDMYSYLYLKRIATLT